MSIKQPEERISKPSMAGYGQYTSPHIQQKVSEVTEKSPSVIYADSEALDYWKKELANRDNKTAFRYIQYFKGFIEYMGYVKVFVQLLDI